jgi:hypothetical protein
MFNDLDILRNSTDKKTGVCKFLTRCFGFGGNDYFYGLVFIIRKFYPKHMMRKLTLFLGALCGLYAGLQAQPLCGFDQQHHQLLRNSTAYAQSVQASDARLNQMAQMNSLIVNTPNGPVYQIPVVVHVVHTGGALGSIYNPTDATITGMINYLNATYAATWPSYPSATTGGTAFPVEFVLAKRAPGCVTTNGIERINGATLLGTNYTSFGVRRSGTNGIADATVKATSNWNHDDYYNIWVVNKIDGQDGTFGTFVAGYAYFQGAPNGLDGTIMLATQAVAGEITLPHEIGHAFNLYHIFEGDDPGSTGSATQCPIETNCATQNDMVCDTEPMRRSPFNCPSGINSCTGVLYANGQRNFMDYSNCQDRFTPGQRTRWINALTSLRPSLISSLGATAITTTATAATCTPTITNPANAVNAGVYDVQFSDMTGATDGGYNTDGNVHYIDKTCTQQANVTAGQAYNISIMTGPAREYVRVYIDYNNDGAFAAGELAYSDNGTTGSPYEVHTGSITIPTTATTCAPLRMRVLSDRFSVGTAPLPCGALGFGQCEDYAVVVKPTQPPVNLAFTPGSANPSCAGTSLSFTASTTGTVLTPVWRWYVNNNFTGATGTSYTSSTLVTGDVVTARLSYTTACNADSTTTNGITINRGAVVTPTTGIAVTTGSNPGCPGTVTGFTAISTNAGSAPTYQWYVGGILQTGVTGNTFSSSSLACNSNIYAVLTSNSTCASTPTATSNTILYTCGTVAPVVTISVISGSNPTCIGRAITFAASPVNGGSSPTYQWYVNGVPVPGATGTSYTSNSYATGDSVFVEMTSNYLCASTAAVRSAATYITTIPSTMPIVTKMITIGSNPGCKDSLIQFTATATFGGAAPTFVWFLNGAPVAGGPVYNNTTANDGDVVWVRMIPSGVGAACYARDTVYSDTTVLGRRATPSKPQIHFIGHNLESDSANVQWYGPAGLIPGAVGAVYTPTAIGTYWAVIRNPLCGTGMSNVLIVSPLSVGGYNMEGVSMYPNPTMGRLTINWTAAATTRITVFTPAGQAVLRDLAAATSNKVLDLSGLASGVYFVNLENEQGAVGAFRVTVMH